MKRGGIMDELNVESVYQLLFDLLAHQENVQINFTLEKKEGGQHERIIKS